MSRDSKEVRLEKKRFRDTYIDGEESKYITVILDVEEINKIINFIYSCTKVNRGRPRERADLMTDSYIQVLSDRVIITCMGYDGYLRRREYGFWLTDSVESMIGGYEVKAEMDTIERIPHHSKYAKTPEQKKKMEELLLTYEIKENGRKKNKHTFAARDFRMAPPLKRGEKHIEKELWCYDIHSAYASIARELFLDFWHPMWVDVVPEGCIGFRPDRASPMAHEGEDCYIAFKIIPSPYREWIDRIYEDKKNAPSSSLARADAKQKLVAGFGYYENWNMFYRTLIVQTLHEKMEELKDEDTYYINTDCIYSKKERPDLELGDEMGQFELEHHGAVKFPSAEYLDEHGKVIKKKNVVHKKIYQYNFIMRRVEKCTDSQRTQSQEKQFDVKTIPLSEVISKLSTRYTGLQSTRHSEQERRKHL